MKKQCFLRWVSGKLISESVLGLVVATGDFLHGLSSLLFLFSDENWQSYNNPLISARFAADSAAVFTSEGRGHLGLLDHELSQAKCRALILELPV